MPLRAQRGKTILESATRAQETAVWPSTLDCKHTTAWRELTALCRLACVLTALW